MVQSESWTEGVSITQIGQRQAFAKRLGRKISDLVANTRELREIVTLLLWHGSLVRGKGGKKYDIDYAVFLRRDKTMDLINAAAVFTQRVTNKLQEIVCRRDLHYDGMTMFEAHTHWDITEESFSDTYIGVHFYREIALQELLGNIDWRVEHPPRSTFFRLLDSWRRYCFFYRHWIYEGVALYDPDSIYKKAKNLSYLPPKWMLEELNDVVRCILSSYSSSPDGICTVSESKQLALDIVAALAYSLEGRPIGLSTRYASDIQEFKDKRARSLLKAVTQDNLVMASRELVH